MTPLSNFPTLQDAAIIQGMLEANGIPSVLSDQNNLYVPVFGGVTILVREQDLDKAIELLRDHNDAQPQ
ncbi:MAG: DUF2007 domain-containing protein [Muribaculaceae bacterium]|nr:DUF2007 domain-containing protein [Muribaculaceae bacterium]